MSEANPNAAGERTRFRKLRIAWSVAWGIACVLVIALWVRSYWRWDSVVWGMTTKTGFLVQSQDGSGLVQYLDVTGVPPEYDASLYEWKYRNYRPGETSALPRSSIAGFVFPRDQPGWTVVFPYWFPVLAFVVLAAAIWLPWRFSLRMLLIVTTLIATLLGAIVYAVK